MQDSLYQTVDVGDIIVHSDSHLWFGYVVKTSTKKVFYAVIEVGKAQNGDYSQIITSTYGAKQHKILNITNSNAGQKLKSHPVYKMIVKHYANISSK